MTDFNSYNYGIIKEMNLSSEREKSVLSSGLLYPV